jgi:hypothetical protein
MTEKKPTKRGSKPPKKRARKVEGAKTIAVALYAREVAILEAAMKRQEDLGSRATISSCLRWALNAVDFEQMPPIY